MTRTPPATSERAEAQPSDALVTRALELFILGAFAIAQPLFSLLSGTANFFVARGSEPIDIVLLTILLMVGVPTALVSAEAIVAGAGFKAAQAALHRLFLVVLASLLVLSILSRVTWLPALFGFSIAVLSGYLLETLQRRKGILQPWIALFVLVFPAAFLLRDPMPSLLFPQDAGGAALDIDAPRDIVFVVFDELALVSLLDHDRSIDRERYPNFAALLDDSVWYRNATTVAEHTAEAVTAILTGLYPDEPRLPTLQHHPDNLISYVAAEYGSENVLEYVTALAPDGGGSRSGQARLPGRLRSLLLDLSVVYAHVVTPAALRERLPPVNLTWQGFVADEPAETTRSSRQPDAGRCEERLPGDAWLRSVPGSKARRFLRYLERICARDAPQLHYVHVMLPHYPWKQTASGKYYTMAPSVIPGLRANKVWEESPGSPVQAYQRHLLQVEMVDRLLGELIARLRAVGTYDDSMIVVVADHGVSFHPGEPSRLVSEKNFDSILAVPLIIKYPGGEPSGVDERHVETVDIVPTVLDVIGADSARPLAGRSLLDSDFVGREVKRVFTQGSKRELSFESSGVARLPSLQRRLDLFGSNHDGLGNYRAGPHSDLVGSDISELPLGSASGSVLQLDQESTLRSLDLNSSFVPVELTGVLTTSPERSSEIDLAIAVNGMVVTTSTLPSVPGEATRDFSALVPESVFVDGHNRVEFFEVAKTEGRTLLSRVAESAPPQYELSSDENGAVLVRSEQGAVWRSRPGRLEGVVDLIKVSAKSNSVSIGGWVIDRREEGRPGAVLLFDHGAYVSESRVGIRRDSIAAKFGRTKDRQSGFSFRLPLTELGDGPIHDLRVVAIGADGVALELEFLEAQDPLRFDRADLPLDLVSRASSATAELDNCPDLALGDDVINLEGRPRFRIVPASLRGNLESIRTQGDTTTLRGFAIDLEGGSAPYQLAFFSGPDCWHQTQTWIERPDVAAYFKSSDFDDSGFQLELPKKYYEETVVLPLRVFALSADGRATELFNTAKSK